MTPTEKAKELIDKFTHPVRWKMGQEDVLERAKQCALIAVDEVLKFIDERMQGWLDADWVSYWQEVKQEIEKL